MDNLAGSGQPGPAFFWILSPFAFLEIEDLRFKRDRLWTSAATAQKLGEQALVAQDNFVVEAIPQFREYLASPTLRYGLKGQGRAGVSSADISYDTDERDKGGSRPAIPCRSANVIGGSRSALPAPPLSYGSHRPAGRRPGRWTRARTG